MKENIEEVVERLEKSINDVWFSTTYSQEDEERDLQALISDYQRLQEEFKQVDHECERLEQKELRLEKEVELAKEVIKKQCDIADERNQLLIENQKLQKENEELKNRWDKDTHKLQNDLDIANAERIELKEENEGLKYKYDKALSDLVNTEKETISKQKIKDKIEYIEKEGYWLFLIDRDSDKCVEVLKDLLEEKGE